MFEHNDTVLSSFNDTLEKVAFNPALLQRVGQRALSGGGLGALGAAGGGVMGGATGGIQGYRQAQEEGQSGLLGALGGVARGAAKGGALGLAAGGLAGAAGGARSQKLVRRLSAGKDRIGGISRFGERQVHSLTGALPQGMSRSDGLRAIGASPVQRLEQRMVAAARRNPKPPSGPHRPRTHVGKLTSELAGLGRAKVHAQKLEELGMTNVPGFFKAMATKPGQALKAGLGHEWHGATSRGAKAMAFGLPAAFVAPEAMRSSKPGEEGRVARTARALASTAPYTIAPMGILGATGLSVAGSGLVGQAGKLVSRKQPLGVTPPPPMPEDGGTSANVERVYSPSAQGRPPEGLI